MKTICDIYRSPNQPEMYIYVTKRDGLKRVPEELLSLFGQPEFSLTLVLTPDRKLRSEDAQKVLTNLDLQGYHLQMPPSTLGQLGRRENQIK